MFGGLDLSPGSSGLVFTNEGGAVVHYEHFAEEQVKHDLFARMRMAERIWKVIREQSPTMLAIEDYAQGIGQASPYTIAEVAGVIKYHLLTNHVPFALVNPSKLKSYVVRKRHVPKTEIIAWAQSHGFPLEKKKPGKPGLYARQREDLADAFVLSKMAAEMDLILSEGRPSLKGHILLDPDNGVLNRPDLLFNNPYFQEFDPHGED